VKCDYRYEKIHFNDVLYVEGMENYVVIHTVAQEIRDAAADEELEEILPVAEFMRPISPTSQL